MAELASLESLQALHHDLTAICERRFENLQLLEQSLQDHAEAFRKLLTKPTRNAKSRSAVESGTIKIADEEYSVNQDFRQSALKLADELDLDELEASKILLAAMDDQAASGRSLLECGVIRFHQQRKYQLDCMRLCVLISNDSSDDLENDELLGAFQEYVSVNIFCEAPQGGQQPPSGQKFVARVLTEMLAVRTWLQRISDSAIAASLLQQGASGRSSELEEVIDFSRVSLIQQHELLAVLLSSAIEAGQAEAAHFREFLGVLRKVDKYDHLLGRFNFSMAAKHFQLLMSSQFTSSRPWALISRPLAPRTVRATYVKVETSTN
jgi:nuclear pore complex protein Nup205